MGTRYDAPAGQHKLADASKTSLVLLLSPREEQVGHHFIWQKRGMAIFMVVLVSLPLVAGAAEVDKKDRQARDTIERLEQSLSSAVSNLERQKIQSEIEEIRTAIENNHRPAIPNYVDFAEFPILMVDALNNPVGIGHTRASNIRANDSTDDLSRLDPISNSIWARPISIRAANLRVGFDRAQTPDYSSILTYAGAKKAGRNAGCVVAAGDLRIKVKFAEIHSEPFTSRIFHAIGYNVDPTDYAPGLKLRYDRRFFQEFNSRRPMKMSTGMFFIPMVRFNLQAKHDPFAYIDCVVFKNGESISAERFKSLLLRHPKSKHNKMSDDEFQTEIEELVDYIVTKAANVQIETPHSHNLGPWDFRGHDHENLRELRGAGVLAAWLGWWDSRFENTRLRVVKTSEGPALKHFWTDLGGGLGRAHGTFSHSCENPNDFGSSFTRSFTRRGKTRFEIKDYEPVEDTAAFAEMTVDDARWMARLIGQFSERQIMDALEASGFKPSEVKVYADKLIARRDNLIRDLQLTPEIALLRPDNARPVVYAEAPKLLSKSR
jgi:hypothetical protein